MAADDERGDTKAMPIGLAENTSGVVFQCGNCEWFDRAGGGFCQNGNRRLKGRKVDATWCCNLFDRDDMKVIVR